MYYMYLVSVWLSLTNAYLLKGNHPGHETYALWTAPLFLYFWGPTYGLVR